GFATSHRRAVRPHLRSDPHLAGARAGRIHRRSPHEMKRYVEVRSYNLKPGRREEFHRLVLDRSMPLVRKWKVDVVDFGPSLHDEDSYYLVRAYGSLAERASSYEAFYSSPE